MNGVVFDTGALIAFERGDRFLANLVSEARRTQSTLTVPSGCVAQAWRHPSRQARLGALLRMSNTDVVAMDDAEARRVGLLLAATETSDIVDGHVALCAHRLGATVVTSDPDDLKVLGSTLRTHRV